MLKNQTMNILVTGAAGFIGMHTCRALLEAGHSVVGLDNLNDYYPVSLKRDRLAELAHYERFTFIKMDLTDKEALLKLFSGTPFDRVIHLAAQAGVRYSITNPDAYVQSNLIGFFNVLEACRQYRTAHLIYASSSSVYGANRKSPFSEEDFVDRPVSFYAATKKSNELMAYCYSHLYQIPMTGLRFFTVYGPWGRPDMAPWLFTKAIMNGQPIKVYNHGNMKRDFTYVDDIVGALVKLLDVIPQPSGDDPADSSLPAPYRICNIGNNRPVDLMDFIHHLGNAIGTEPVLNLLPMQPGDVPATCADVSRLNSLIGYTPTVSVQEGVERFVEWFVRYQATSNAFSAQELRKTIPQEAPLTSAEEAPNARS